MRIVYTLNAGLAENIRPVKDDYTLQLGEYESMVDGSLPSIEDLSDRAAVKARDDTKSLFGKKQAAIAAMESKRWDDLLAQAAVDVNAPEEVKDYIKAVGKAK